jgi:nicotinate-nucleotide adenylyltransferase
VTAGGPAGRRIGVFGGTFDPVHIGHLVAANEVRWKLGLDVTLLMVAGEPWQKAGRPNLSPAADRLAGVEAAVEGIDGLEASSLEVDRSGPTYTADTLAELRASEPDAALFLIVGADVTELLDTWERPDEVQALATLVAVERPGSRPVRVDRLRAQGWRVETVAIPALEVSSSDVRARLAEGRPIDFLVPPGTVRVLRERGRYARR